MKYLIIAIFFLLSCQSKDTSIKSFSSIREIIEDNKEYGNWKEELDFSTFLNIKKILERGGWLSEDNKYALNNLEEYEFYFFSEDNYRYFIIAWSSSEYETTTDNKTSVTIRTRSILFDSNDSSVLKSSGGTEYRILN